MPKRKGPNKPRKKRYNLTSKLYTHAGGRKGRSSVISTTKRKRKHGRK